jgi:hypothetical protein
MDNVVLNDIHCLWQGELKKNKQKNPTTLI